MSAEPDTRRRRGRGGAWGPVLVVVFVATGVLMALELLVWRGPPRAYGLDIAFGDAMFGPRLAQPIAFSHRLHVTDKEIDCFYCHPYGERSQNAGLPSVAKCMGCHDHIIPTHREIVKLEDYRDRGEGVPWVRVYYNPDHAYFPHFRHLGKDVRCQECHGEVERADRLHKVTFYMGFCLECHREREAAVDCVACHG